MAILAPVPDFGSILTAMVTPFDERGALDEEAIVGLMHHLVAQGSDGVVLSGTTGEASTLTDPEKIRLFELGVQELRGRGTVVAGTGSNDTAHSVHLTEVAAGLGVDAVLAVTPYYNRPPRAGLVGHFAAIAAVGVPVILYNIPSRAVVNLPPDLIAELAEIPGIVALKEANPDQVGEVLAIDGLAVYAGNDDLLCEVVVGGGAGVISVASHLVGRQMQAVCAAARAGDRAEAERLDAALHGLYEGLFTTTSPILIKAAVEMVGAIPSARVRLPLVEATPEERGALSAMLEAQDILVRAS
jgi:4-hydroxy-tetrahydrodipicolinate synthase